MINIVYNTDNNLDENELYKVFVEIIQNIQEEENTDEENSSIS